MIRKLSAFLILAFIGWGYLQAQEAKTCFKNMPDSICPLLSAVNRADFIDFLESKMKAEVTNSFGGKSEHRSGSCGTASALPKCSIIRKVLSALLAWHLPHLARRIST